MIETASISDLPFDDYTNRQLIEVSAERNEERSVKVKPAGNFLFSNNSWLPQEYEGFAIISMLSDHQENTSLTERLIKIQHELKYNLEPRYGFYYLPAESFHQTVANTLSADRFKDHILNPGLESEYPSIISNAFSNIEPVYYTEPIRMKMAGLSVFGTAIGILGLFEDPDDYKRIINFRKEFYADKQLAKLDVKMTRPFIGHITLAYIEHGLNKNQKNQLAAVIKELNESLATESNYFTIAATGLRRYHHLGEFIKQDNYPAIAL